MKLSATVAPGLELAASDRIVVGVVAAVALAALAIGFVLLREVLAAGQGTEKMQEISRAVQEGAAAYLNRQFRTLAIFVVVVFVLLFALPADDIGERIGRSIFFVIGAVFSATIGYLGMWLATRANVRVAAGRRPPGSRSAPVESSACSPSASASSVPRSSCSSTPVRHPVSWRASASARRCSRCSCG